MKILIGINILTSVKAAAYLSHMNMIYRWGRDYPDAKFMLFTPERMSIDRMRNESARIALDTECDYLMFVDDDVIVEPQTLRSLIDANKDVVAEETYIRGYPFDAMFFKRSPDGNLHCYNEFMDYVGPDGLVECDAVGFSCVLIKTELLKKLTKPYFVTGESFTEDVYFCLKAKDELPETTIYTDTKYPTGHILGPEAISRKNKEAHKAFHEAQMRAFDPNWMPPDRNEHVWRGTKDVEQLKEIFNED